MMPSESEAAVEGTWYSSPLPSPSHRTRRRASTAESINDSDLVDVTLVDVDADFQGGAAQLINDVGSWIVAGGATNDERVEIPSLLMEPENFKYASKLVLADLSRHYLAIAIACWFMSTFVQGLSMGLMILWEYWPIIVALSIMLLSILVYWYYVWKHLQVPFRRLWTTPYPFAGSTAVLGALAQHTILVFEHGFNTSELVISFFLMQALYITLVAAAYQQFMQKWQKFIRHRKLWFIRHKVQHQQHQPLLSPLVGKPVGEQSYAKVLAAAQTTSEEEEEGQFVETSNGISTSGPTLI